MSSVIKIQESHVVSQILINYPQLLNSFTIKILKGFVKRLSKKRFFYNFIHFLQNNFFGSQIKLGKLLIPLYVVEKNVLTKQRRKKPQNNANKVIWCLCIILALRLLP